MPSSQTKPNQSNQNLDMAVNILFHTNDFSKSINPSVLPPAIGK